MEACSFGGLAEPVEVLLFVVEVEEAVAAVAVQVRVAVGLRVVAALSAHIAYRGLSVGDQLVEIAVDRAEGDAGEPAADLGEDLVGGRVVEPVEGVADRFALKTRNHSQVRIIPIPICRWRRRQPRHVPAAPERLRGPEEEPVEPAPQHEPRGPPDPSGG